MHSIKKLLLIILLVSGINTYAQDNSEYGNTLNLGVGIGYYGYIGSSTPVFHMNYEIGVAENFTLAPFLTYFQYRRYQYWNGPNNPGRNYYYQQTVIPIGLKGTYYFDDILNAGSKWDFYLAGSLGAAIRRTRWEDGYNGEREYRGSGPLYFDFHIGTEYHLNDKAGLFLDLSSGISTVGLAVHF